MRSAHIQTSPTNTSMNIKAMPKPFHILVVTPGLSIVYQLGWQPILFCTACSTAELVWSILVSWASGAVILHRPGLIVSVVLFFIANDLSDGWFPIWSWHVHLVAESEGFEPPEPLSSSDFKSGAFDHSANSPGPYSGMLSFRFVAASPITGNSSPKSSIDLLKLTSPRHLVSTRSPS